MNSPVMFLRKVGTGLRQLHLKFRTFSQNFDSNNAFKELQLVVDTYKDVKLTPLRLKGCSFGKPFTSTNVSYEKFYVSDPYSRKADLIEPNETDEEWVPQVKFESIYQEAFEDLKRLCDGKLVASNIGTTDFIFAARNLLCFLSDIETHEKALRREKNTPEIDILDDDEGVVAVLLTSHLLSPLVQGHEYVISDGYNSKPKYCPCLSACMKKIDYGPTSIGNEDMWYGSADIILNLPNSVMVEPENHEKKTKKKSGLNMLKDELADKSDVKTKDRLISQNVTSRMISQTILFSLYASSLKKRRPELTRADVTLIPSLLLTPYHYFIYMYDYQHDVLLTSNPKSLKVWDNTGYRFNKSAILQLWMLLNHMKCTLFLHPNHLNYIKGSSNFQNLCTVSGLDLSDIEKHILFKSQFNPVEEQRLKFDLVP